MNPRRLTVPHPTDPTARIVLLTKGCTAVIDAEDAARVERHNWQVTPEGYARTGYNVRGKPVRISMHRFVCGAVPGVQFDHVDGDRLNNRKRNLRRATSTQNAANRHDVRGKSRYRGVTYIRVDNSWRAQIRVKGTTCTLGQFKDEDEAGLTYAVAARMVHGDYAWLGNAR